MAKPKRREKWSVAKKKIDNENIKRMRLEVEDIVNISYWTWMRTVPPKAKRFLARLKGYHIVGAHDYILAADLVRDNVHLCDKIQDIILSREFINPPNVTHLCQTYEMIRKHGELAEICLLDGKYRTFKMMHSQMMHFLFQ